MLLSPMYGANTLIADVEEIADLLSPMYGANAFDTVGKKHNELLSPMYGANKNKFYKYSYFSIRYIIKPIIT